MATIKIKNLAAVEAEFKRRANEAIKQRRLLNRIGEDLAKQIVGSAREGKFIGNGSRLSALDADTVPQRQRLSRSNSTHPAYSPRRSNLTLTGELLDSIKHNVNESRGEVIVEAKGTHPGYKTLGGSSSSSRTSNADILRFQASMGRNVIGINDKLRERYRQFVIEEIRRNFR